MLAFQYKPNAADVAARLRLLYAAASGGPHLCSLLRAQRGLPPICSPVSRGPVPVPRPESRIAFWDRLLAEQRGVEDDAIPAAYLSEMDQGLYGGMLGGEVRVHGPSGERLDFLDGRAAAGRLVGVRPGCGSTRQTPWFQRYLQQLDVFVRGAAGRFGISHFILIDSLNFVFELVGATETYMACRQPRAWSAAPSTWRSS